MTLTDVQRRTLAEAEAIILRQGESFEAIRTLVSQALRDKITPTPTDSYVWIRDFFGADTVVYEYEGKSYQATFTIAGEGDAKTVTIGDSTEVEIAYMPVGESRIEIAGDFIALREKATRADGSVPIKVISPGWGSSGYYAPEMLERDGPSVFAAGTKMYWDHPTTSEEADRPERSLRDLAAELVTGATWQEAGADGPGLYADAKVFSPYRECLEDLAPHIGVSIRALGQAKTGEADGRRGAIIEKIVAAKSVDFVTEPGAGGKVLQLFESARGGQTRTPEVRSTTMDEKEITALKEANEASAKEIKELKEAAERDRQDAARTREALQLREARDIAQVALAKTTLPTVTQTRLVEQLARTAPVKEGKLDTEAYATAIDEAAKAEAAYLAEVTGSGRIQGMGSGPAPTLEPEKATERMASAFQRLGLSEATAKVAAAGRN